MCRGWLSITGWEIKRPIHRHEMRRQCARVEPVKSVIMQEVSMRNRIQVRFPDCAMVDTKQVADASCRQWSRFTGDNPFLKGSNGWFKGGLLICQVIHISQLLERVEGSNVLPRQMNMRCTGAFSGGYMPKGRKKNRSDFSIRFQSCKSNGCFMPIMQEL